MLFTFSIEGLQCHRYYSQCTYSTVHCE